MKMLVLLTFVIWGVVALVAFLYQSKGDEDD